MTQVGFANVMDMGVVCKNIFSWNSRFWRISVFSSLRLAHHKFARNILPFAMHILWLARIRKCVNQHIGTPGASSERYGRHTSLCGRLAGEWWGFPLPLSIPIYHTLTLLILLYTTIKKLLRRRVKNVVTKYARAQNGLHSHFKCWKFMSSYHRN